MVGHTNETAPTTKTATIYKPVNFGDFAEPFFVSFQQITIPLCMFTNFKAYF